MQLKYYNTNFKQQTFPITIICDNVTNAPNIGSLFRIADAFGVEKIIFCGTHIPMGRKMTKTSGSTEQYVNYEIKESALSTAIDYQKMGYKLIALEITDCSTPICEMQLTGNGPIALLVGDENFGISEEVLKSSDLVLHINMFGQNSSMNVVQATNIVLYELTKQLNTIKK